MKKIKYITFFILILFMMFASSCQRDKILKTSVREIDKYGHAILKISRSDFENKGYELGDIVQISINNKVYHMPYFNGYYVDEGEYLLYASNTKDQISASINFGQFYLDSNAKAGDEVKISMFEKGGALGIQIANSLVHSNKRDDYDSDEIFSNFRTITLGNIKENILYRSASPINNKHNRAAITNKLIKHAQIKTIANLADNKEIIYEAVMESTFDSQYYVDLYENGQVKFFTLTLNFRTDEFGQLATNAVIYISENEGPYLVHCTEGDFRTDFVIMLISLVMGASVDEICNDYMMTYKNYYNLTKESDLSRYNSILDSYCMESLRHIAGVEKGGDISNIDFETKAKAYLMKYGMTEKQIDDLITKLEK
jgi:protein tyrosine/serine phosphatase